MSLLAVQPSPAASGPDAAVAPRLARLSPVPPLAEVVGGDLTVPLVQGGVTRYVNLDYAASAPALRAVADRVAELLPLYSSVHRGAGYASAVCTSAYEGARAEIAGFIDARDDDVVIFTRNTTDALNLLAAAVPADALDGGLGGVVHLDVEHHANLLPWQRLGSRTVRAGGTRAQTARRRRGGTRGRAGGAAGRHRRVERHRRVPAAGRADRARAPLRRADRGRRRAAGPAPAGLAGRVRD